MAEESGKARSALDICTTARNMAVLTCTGHPGLLVAARQQGLRVTALCTGASTQPSACCVGSKQSSPWGTQ
eukprot:12914106-Prorocentrum_lima.AAC.1